MTPDMPIEEMIDTFIFVAKDRCVIDWREIDWEAVRYLPRTSFAGSVHKVADLKAYFIHRKTRYGDPITDWTRHLECKRVPTLHDAVEMAARLRRENLYRDGELLIDIAAMERNAKMREKMKRAPDWVRRMSRTC